MKARLDRAFANDMFLTSHEHTRFRHITSIEYDHCFVVAKIRGSKQFCYENVWQTHCDYDDMVCEVWKRHRRD